MEIPENVEGQLYNIIREGLDVILKTLNLDLTENAIVNNLQKDQFLQPLRNHIAPHDPEVIKRVTAFIREKKISELNHENIDKFILYCSLAVYNSAGVGIELALLHFLIAFSKMGNINTITAKRRVKSFNDNNDHHYG